MNNRQLLEQLITQQLDNAYRFAYTYTKNQAMSEDVVSESVLKALKNIHTLKNPNYIKTWFYRIIINTALSYLKKENQVIPFTDQGEQSGAISFEEQFENMDLHEIIEKMDEKYRTVLVLRFFEDMTLQEIAYTLEENINTIKSRLYRGLSLLKIELEEIS